jgi:probable phosphoglycerate mutase
VRLLLVRHGQTPTNISGVIDTGAPGPGLTEHGRAQARAVVGALAREDVSHLFCSPLVRTQLTAQPLADHLGLRPLVVDGLEEIVAGDLEGREDDDSHRQYNAVLDAWFAGDLDRSLPGAPDGHAFLRRFDAALDRVVEASAGTGGTAVVFCHAAAIRAFLVLRLGLTDRPIDNTGAAVVEGDASGWELRAWTGDPLGGPGLRSPGNHDVTGDPDAETLDA